MKDLISRQDAIDALLKADCGCGIDSADVIRKVPFAELPIKEKCCVCPHCENCDVNEDGTIERKKGEWIKINKYDKESDVQCSVCFEDFDYIGGVCYLCHGFELPLFCPNCGADMRGEENDRA